MRFIVTHLTKCDTIWGSLIQCNVTKSPLLRSPFICQQRPKTERMPILAKGSLSGLVRWAWASLQLNFFCWKFFPPPRLEHVLWRMIQIPCQSLICVLFILDQLTQEIVKYDPALWAKVRYSVYWPLRCLRLFGFQVSISKGKIPDHWCL